ncbi:MAG: hypothetical protein ABFC77_02565 [Thermoguttaceae bacterium]
MNRLLFFAVVCIAVGLFCVFSSGTPGVAVSANETAHLMGSDITCSQFNTTRSYVCYGGNCMSGGCGCMIRYNLIAGDTTYTTTTVPCRDNINCTATRYQLTGTPCGGGGGGGNGNGG